MRTSVVLAALVGAFAVDSLAAQGGEEIHPNRRRVLREVIEKRDAMREGRVVRRNVYVTVRLRNGSKLSGVVKNGRFVEAVAGLDFVEADKRNPGAGLRLWYFDNTNSYIFLSYESILRYKIGYELSDRQVKAIEEKIEEQEKRARDARTRDMQRREEQAGEKKEGEKATEKVDELLKENEERAKAAAEEGRLMALLDEFPPGDGWGAERLQEIQRRKVVLGMFPDEKEKRFIEVFREWEQAVAMREAKVKQATKEQEQGGGDPDRD